MLNVTTEVMRTCRTAQSEVKQFAAEIRLMSDGAIGKVLATQAYADVAMTEVLSGEIDASGRVEAKVLYVDGEGVRKVMEAEAPFRERIAANVAPSDYVVTTACVVEVTTVRAETEAVTLKVIVELRAVFACERPVEIVSNCGSDVYLKTKQTSCMCPSAKIDQTFVVPADKEMDDIEGELLDLDCGVCITNVTARTDSLVIDGETITNALYKATDGRLKNNCFHVSFTQEIPVAGIRPDAVADLCACIVSHEHTVACAEGVPTVLKSMYTVRVSGIVYQPVSCAVMTDAFSVTHGIRPETEEVKLGSVMIACMGHPVEGSAMLEEGMPACDTVLGVTAARICVANAYARDGRTVVEGVLNCSVLYYNKEFGSTNSVSVDMPYSVTLNIASMGDVSATAAVLSVSAKSIRSSKIDVMAEAFFCVRSICTETVVVIKTVEDLGASPEETSAISVRIAGENQELWDLAKACGLTPEAVLAQNPELSFPTKGGEKIVIYRQICV